MKKHILSLLALLFTTHIAYVQTLTVDGVTYAVDTLQNHQVGPGTDYIQLSLTGSKRLDVYFLKTDLKNEYIEIRTALGQDSIYTGERPSAVAKRKSTEGAFYFAGTNGDFYETAGYIGYPVGGNMVNSEIAKIPTSRNLFAIDDQNIPDIGLMTYQGKMTHKGTDYTINSVNHERKANKLVLYNRHNGKYTHTDSNGTEALVELLTGEEWGVNKTLKAKVLKTEKGVGGMAIPPGKAVLSGDGTAGVKIDALAEGDEVEIRLNMILNENTTANYTAITASDNYKELLKDGVIEQTSIWNEYHPRTAIGFSQNKDTLIFCVIDGRGVSVGATTKGVAELLKSAGAYTAMNMDGGGSSAMYVAEYGGPVNRTSDSGGERAVANCIFTVSTAPTDNTIASIKPYKSVVNLPRFAEYIPQFRSYNKYGVLLDGDQQDILLSCPEELGTIAGNKFIATGNQEGALTASYNGIITEIQIKFIPATGIEIRLDSVLIDSRKPYEIEVTATTENGKLPISPRVMDWRVEDETICTVENGIVNALKNGKTKLTGELDGIRDEIIIVVETPELSPVIIDSMKAEEWEMKANSSLKAKLNEENRPAGWEHGMAVNFVYAIDRAPSIKLTKDIRIYGLPDTLKMHINMGGLKIERAILYMSANNAIDNVSKEFNVFEQNKDFTLDIPVADMFNANDRGIYPLHFEYIQFYLSSDMEEGKACTLAIKDLKAYYKGINTGSGISLPEQDYLIAYPNPLIGETLYVQLANGLSQDLDVMLYTLSGQCIYSSRYHADSKGRIEIPVKGLSKGTYILRIYQQEELNVIKIVK